MSATPLGINAIVSERGKEKEKNGMMWSKREKSGG